jgi:hypothetical protein
MMERARRPKNLRLFDYHHEKVALTQVGHWLKQHGWEDVWPSVPPAEAFGDGPKTPLELQRLDADLVTKFNSDDEKLWRTRYTFYRDSPGNLDLVARRRGELLILDGKGRSATNKRGAVAQMVGGHVLARRHELTHVMYAIVIPGRADEDPEEGPPALVEAEAQAIHTWDRALRNTGGLDWIRIFRVSRRKGIVTEDNWTDTWSHTMHCRVAHNAVPRDGHAAS